jgi:hypothetical protein
MGYEIVVRTNRGNGFKLNTKSRATGRRRRRRRRRRN